jgi:hypothetical protein
MMRHSRCCKSTVENFVQNLSTAVRWHVAQRAATFLISGGVRVKRAGVPERWPHFPEQNGGLAKMDSGFDYAANFSWFACVA